MAVELFLGLLGYSFVTSVTPGPNNFMLLASGVNFGFARSIPHMLGISTGFFSLVIAVGFGLGALLVAFPTMHLALKVLGGTYLLYLAWRIASSRSIGTSGAASNGPMTFMQAAAFQWINPKAWIMALTATAIYTNAERPYLSALVVGLTFACVNLPSVSIWAGFGVTLRQFLSDPARLRWFNIGMGVLLALTLWPLVR